MGVFDSFKQQYDKTYGYSEDDQRSNETGKARHDGRAFDVFHGFKSNGQYVHKEDDE